MRTIYSNTSSIQEGGNLVDLERFRQKRDLAQRDSLARQPQEEPWVPEEPAFRPVVLTTTPAQRRRARRERQAWRLDVCASLAIILMTVIFAVWVIF